MWLKKMRKRKIQYFIIAFILMISTAILLACISFTLETRKFVDDYYQYDKCPILFDIVKDKNGIDILENDKDVMNLLDHVETCKAKYVQDEFYNGDTKLTNESILVYTIDDVNKIGYSLPIVDGDDVSHPADGEIWICRIFAKATGLGVGDEFKIGDKNGKTYTISAIVDSPECSSGFIDNYPCYVNSDSIEDVPGNMAYGVQMYVKDADVSYKDIDDVLPEEYKNIVASDMNRNTLKLCLSILATIFGGVGVAAAILILAVSIIVIRYMVRSVIHKEFHMIGIYMATGKSNKDIKKMYFSIYMVTGFVGIAVGIVAGRPLAEYLAKEIICGMNGFSLSYITNIFSLLIVIFMASVLAFNIWRELKKINKITPIQALDTGIRSSKKKISRSVIKNAHSSLSVAINQIFKNKSMSILLVLVLTVSYYTCLFSGAVGLSLSHYSDDREIWENLPDYNGYIKVSGDQDIKEYLEESEYIDDYVYMTFDITSKVKMSFKGIDMTMDDANPMVYDNFTEERYENVPYTSGRICTNPHEITASEKFLKETDTSVGDYITININNKDMDFLIVGSYSAMMRGGVSFYMQAQDFAEAGVTPELNNILFFLKDGKSYDDFEKDFKEHFSESKIYRDFKSTEQEGETVTDIAYPICVVLFVSFLSFSVLNIVNVIYTQNREKRKEYGILKAMGFSTGYICRVNIIQLSLESVVAILVTVILNETLSPILYSLACGIKYINKPVWLTVLTCSGIYGILMLITVVMLLGIRKISPVELIEE